MGAKNAGVRRRWQSSITLPLSAISLAAFSWIQSPSAALRATGKTIMLLTYGITADLRSEEHTSELQSLMRISYAVFCLKKKKKQYTSTNTSTRYKQISSTP